MTRSAGSVPEGRTRTRPRGPSRPCASRDRRSRSVRSPSHWSRWRAFTARCCCGQQRDPRGQVGERRPLRRHDPQHLERGHDAVARGRVLEDDDVAALLAAEDRARRPACPRGCTCRPTGVRRTWPPAASTASWRPPLESTETTSPPPGSAPRRAGRARGCRGPGRRPRSVPRHRPRSGGRRRRRGRSPTSAPRCDDAPPRARPGRWPRDRTLMFTPSGSAWIDLHRRAGRGQDPRADAGSRTRWRSRARSGGRRRRSRAASPSRCATIGVHERRAAVDPGRASALATPASSSARQISCSSSSSTASSSLRPSRSRTLSPLSSAGLCEAETMIPAGERPVARQERQRRRRDDARRPGRRRRRCSPRPRWRTRTCRRSGACPGRRRCAPPGAARWCAVGAAQRVGQRRLEVDVRDAADAVGAEQPGHGQPPAGDWDADGDADGDAGTRSVTVTSTVSGLVGDQGQPGWQGRGDVDRRGARREAGDIEVHDQGRTPRGGRGRRPTRRWSRARGRRRSSSRGRRARPTSWTPASNVRVDVIGRKAILTETRCSPIGTTPVGRSQVGVRGQGARRPVDRDGHRVDADERAQLVGVALDGHDGRGHRDGLDLEPGRGRPADDRLDRQRPGLAVREHRQRHVDEPRREVHAG